MATNRQRRLRERLGMVLSLRALPALLIGLGAPLAQVHGQTTVDTRMERDTVGARSRPEVKTSGARVGALLISPSFGIEADATDNVYARGDVKRGDIAAALKPALEVRSQWSHHALGLAADGMFKRYARRKTENVETYSVVLDGRLDISADTRISGDVGGARRIEARGTTGDTLFGAAPIAFTMLSAGGGVRAELRARTDNAGRPLRTLSLRESHAGRGGDRSVRPRL